MSGNKQPVSVLVLVHSSDGHVLLLERAQQATYWQSVTGSLEYGESTTDAALRELAEETGLKADPDGLTDWHLNNHFEIYPLWRDRYPEGITHNREHVFSLALPEPRPIQLSVAEHRAFRWLPWQEAVDQVFSWTNRDAILLARTKLGWR